MKLVAVKLSDEQLADLDRAAKAAHNTRSGILRLALDRFLEKASTAPQEREVKTFFKGNR